MVGLGSILFQCVSDLSFLFLSYLFFLLEFVLRHVGLVEAVGGYFIQTSWLWKDTFINFYDVRNEPKSRTNL